MVIGPFLPKMNANILRCEAIWFQNCAFKCIHVGGVCVVCVCVCVCGAHTCVKERGQIWPVLSSFLLSTW